jgi:GDPmannose 4,6-dehydratase
MIKRALITGTTGQDGAYLAKFLIEKRYEVYGTYRRLSTPNFWRLQYLKIFDQVQLIPCDLLDSDSLSEALKISDPDEIYNLAAQSFVGASFEQPISSGEITGLGVTRLLECVRKLCPHAKVYQASTSELYGNNVCAPQTEETPFTPSSPYAAAKLYAYYITEVYREGYGLFACNGILFNHESPLRGLEFVTRKITNAVAKIKLGLETELLLGNINAKRDWGYAEDFVEAMWLMLQQDRPMNFVIATNEAHSVLEFVEKAFSYADLDYREFIRSDERFLRPCDVEHLCGDYSKAKKILGWEPEVKFNELVKLMVDRDLERWTRAKAGEHFPWDAFNYPNENRILSRTWKMDT